MRGVSITDGMQLKVALVAVAAVAMVSVCWIEVKWFNEKHHFTSVSATCDAQYRQKYH